MQCMKLKNCLAKNMHKLLQTFKIHEAVTFEDNLERASPIKFSVLMEVFYVGTAQYMDIFDSAALK